MHHFIHLALVLTGLTTAACTQSDNIKERTAKRAKPNSQKIFLQSSGSPEPTPTIFPSPSASPSPEFCETPEEYRELGLADRSDCDWGNYGRPECLLDTFFQYQARTKVQSTFMRYAPFGIEEAINFAANNGTIPFTLDPAERDNPDLIYVDTSDPESLCHDYIAHLPPNAFIKAPDNESIRFVQGRQNQLGDTPPATIKFLRCDFTCPTCNGIVPTSSNDLEPQLYHVQVDHRVCPVDSISVSLPRQDLSSFMLQQPVTMHDLGFGNSLSITFAEGLCGHYEFGSTIYTRDYRPAFGTPMRIWTRASLAVNTWKTGLNVWFYPTSVAVWGWDTSAYPSEPPDWTDVNNVTLTTLFQSGGFRIPFEDNLYPKDNTTLTYIDPITGETVTATIRTVYSAGGTEL